MTARRVVLGVCSLAAFVLAAGIALGARIYPDPVGDVKGGGGPDITSIAVSNTKTAVTFRVRFATAPPLRVSTREGWIDMLLIGIDVPPLGPAPTSPGGEWRGANFALGLHGSSATGRLVQLGGGKPTAPRREARFTVVARGSTLTFSVPRTALHNPRWFVFNAAAARETESVETGGGVDIAPGRGTFRYALTR